jgi:hypothetical protein
VRRRRRRRRAEATNDTRAVTRLLYGLISDKASNERQVSERSRRPRKPPLLAAITAIIQVRVMRESRRLRRMRSKKSLPRSSRLWRPRSTGTRPFFVLSLQLAAGYPSGEG